MLRISFVKSPIDGATSPRIALALSNRQARFQLLLLTRATPLRDFALALSLPPFVAEWGRCVLCVLGCWRISCLSRYVKVISVYHSVCIEDSRTVINVHSAAFCLKKEDKITKNGKSLNNITSLNPRFVCPARFQSLFIPSYAYQSHIAYLVPSYICYPPRQVTGRRLWLLWRCYVDNMQLFTSHSKLDLTTQPPTVVLNQIFWEPLHLKLEASCLP